MNIKIDRYALTFNECIANALKLDQYIDVAHSNILQLDIDSEDALAEFNSRWSCLSKYFKFFNGEPQITPSKDKSHYHIRIRSKKYLGVPERILIQIIFNSDFKRELTSYIRYLKGEVYPIMLFEDKE